MELKILADWFGKTNVKDKGAVADNTTDCYAAVQAALTDGGSNRVITIPAGLYKKTTTTAWAVAGSNITIYAYGAVIDCSGGHGFSLTGGDQSNITLVGAHIKNWIGTAFGLDNGSPQIDSIKKNITVANCKFTDVSSSSTVNIHAVRLDCRAKNTKIIDNHFESIVSSNTSATVRAIIVGEKGDASTRAGSPPTEAWDYGYSGSDILTAESGTIVRGNTIRNVSNANVGGGILVDGWRAQITGNVIEGMNYTGASTAPVEGWGIYTRGYEHTISGNSITDCRGYHILAKDSSSSTTWGGLGNTLITNNTFRSYQYASTAIIGLTNGYAKITGNYFTRCRADSTTTKAVIWVSSDLPEVAIEDNTFDRCHGDHMVYGNGSGFSCRGNRVVHPRGPVTTGTEWQCFKYVNTAATYGVTFEDNEIRLDQSDLSYPLTSSNKFCFYIAPAAKIGGLTVKNNRLIGTATGTPTGTWGLIRAAVTVDTQDHWIIEGNWADAVWRGLNTYTDVTLNGATVWPQRMTRATKFPGWVKAQAGGTLAADETGGVFVNEGAVGTWGFTLPAAVPGLVFGFVKTVAQVMTATPNGSETIGACAAGAAFPVAYGAVLKLICHVAGQWVVESMPAASRAAAAPTTGTWLRGDIVYNDTPSAAGNIGWVCVSGGTPGTWKEFGVIAV